MEQMAVGGEGERYMVQACVVLGLFEPRVRRGVFSLSLNDSNWHHLFLNRKVEHIVGAPLTALVAGARFHERPGRLFASDPIFAPATLA